MTTASASTSISALPRGRLIAYWVATGLVAGPSLMAGAVDLFRLQPYFGVLLHLGYPAYFGSLLGVWKILGAVALLAPGYPRVKEWAYAGLFIDYTAAVVSYLAVHDGAAQLAGPIFSLAFLVASWALRPPSRRLGITPSGGEPAAA
jgi:hypothetical protein